MRSSPCNGCTERFIACSDRCPKDARDEYGYKAWRADLEVEKKARKEYYQQVQSAWSEAKKRAKWNSLKRDYSGATKKFSS